MSAKKSIWTPANVVTCARVVLVPLWLLVAELVGVPSGETLSWSAMGVFAFFLLISLTDKVDGYLARSRNEVTTFGKFLDPIADKLAVVVSLCFLLEHGVVGSWVLLVVISREFLVSGLRMVVASRGVVIAASYWGKFKTTFQMIMIILLILDLGGVFTTITTIVTWAALILTVVSLVDYLAKNKGILLEGDI